ncbi:glutathione-dependent formaldehyde-activating enzyme [Colletotrichum sojae]|uniref:Glutathione-dependent formaldehyde-activating enzyme n=1 Tax=Colletotrichum sojae TaxID=2175907 RepID=A0A8H6J6E4_9PEZI|nr:glutathione-dependent formaldehyde-activating enzyme [Colletotrichum sojae]
MVLKGSCMCQAIKYESVSDDPQTTALCHCVDCQKWSGSAFTSNAVVPRASFKVTQGEPKFYDVTGASGKINKHFFCPTCGSSLYTELELMPEVTCIKAGGLDEGKAGLDGKPAVEFYCKDRVAYLGDVKGADQKPAFG